MSTCPQKLGEFSSTLSPRIAKKIKALKLLCDPSISPKVFARQMGYKSVNSAYKSISRLIRDGYLTNNSTPITRTLTNSGKQLIIQVDKLGYTPLSLSTLLSTKKTKRPDIARLHALQFSLDPVNKEYWNNKRFLGEIQIRKYSIRKYKQREQSKITDFWVNNMRIQTNARGIELFLPEVVTTDPRLLLDEAHKQVLEAIPIIEKIFKIEFNKPNTIRARLSKQEIALLNNEMALIFASKGIKSIKVYDENGVNWATLDYSLSDELPEWEFKHTQSADMDLQRFKQFMNEQRDPNNFLPSDTTKILHELRALQKEVIRLNTTMASLTIKHEERIKKLEIEKGIPEVRGGMYA